MFRRLRLWLNGFRFGYRLKRKSGGLRIVVPSSEQRAIRSIKLILTVVGLVSAFFVFRSVWYAFFFGVVLWVVGLAIERVVFGRTAFFLHALPTFEVDPDKWVGVGFGHAQPPGGSMQIPLVGMMITDLDYAKRIDELLLTWCYGERNDEAGNISISIIVLSEDEYVFLLYPGFNRRTAREAFEKAEAELRTRSLEDELFQMHGLLVLGKRCRILPGSYFATFRKRWRPGVPVMFGCWLPPFERPQFHPELDSFVIHSLKIKHRSELTRKDMEYDMYGGFEKGGRWQGPNLERGEKGPAT